MTTSSPHRPVIRAFTLIELLVVISIIALLVAILLPALKQARESARTSVCASNQRQVALASTSYVADFNYYPLQRYDGSDNSKVLYVPATLLRGGYTTGYGVWGCPSHPEGTSLNLWYRDTPHPNWPSNFEYPPDYAVGSYGYNHDYFSVTKFWGFYPSPAASQLAASLPTWHNMPIHNASAMDSGTLKPLSRIGMFADAYETRLDSGERMEATADPNNPGVTWLRFRHSGSTLNITFGDGHGEQISHSNRIAVAGNNKTYRPYFAAWHQARP